MKRLLSIMLLIFLLSTNTFAETLPSLNEALRHITSKDRIEIDPDEFKDFNPENTGKVNYGNFKMIVLQRKAADKEFTKLDSGYPDNYIEGFPDDFTGVDIGKPTVWLRYDVMRSIPASYKARTLEEADIIVIAEDEYVFSGTLSVADYKSENSGEKEIPTVVNSPEELDEFLSKQQPEIDSIYYYPKFSVYNLVTIYDAKTKKCEYYNTKYTPAKIFARNRDAVEHWMLMEQVAELYDSLINDQKDNIYAQINSLADIDEKQVRFWKQCVEAEQYEACIASVDAYYWSMAEQLVELDTDYDHKKNLDKAIMWKSRKTLENLVSYYDYSGFDTPIESIRFLKQYIQRADEQWNENVLQEFIEMMNKY